MSRRSHRRAQEQCNFELTGSIESSTPWCTRTDGRTIAAVWIVCGSSTRITSTTCCPGWRRGDLLFMDFNEFVNPACIHHPSTQKQTPRHSSRTSSSCPVHACKSTKNSHSTYLPNVRYGSGRHHNRLDPMCFRIQRCRRKWMLDSAAEPI